MSTSEQGPEVVVGTCHITVPPELLEHAHSHVPNKHPKGVLGDQVEQPELVDESELATGEN